MINDHKQYAYMLHRLAEYNRQYAADNLIKSHAPNASELCTKKMDFKGVLHDMSTKSGKLTRDNIEPIIDAHTTSQPVETSKRAASVDMSQAALLNRMLYRLLNHSFTEERSIIDGFRPQ